MWAQPSGESREHRWLSLPNRLRRAWLSPGTPFPQPRGCTASCIPRPTGLFGSFSTENPRSGTVWMRAGKPSQA